MISEPKALPAPDDFIMDYAKKMQVALVEASFWKCCLNCEHWSNNSPERREAQATTTCYKWNATPPPDVLVYACPAWMTVVPF